MKTLTFVSLFILFSVVLSAQTPGNKAMDPEKQRIYLDLAGGLSWTSGKNYADLDRNNPKAGYADKGYFFHAEVDFMGKQDFGLAVHYNFQHNPIQVSARNTIPLNGPDSLGIGSWNNHYLLIGPVYMKSISKFVIEAKLLGGIILSFSPVYNTRNLASNTIDANHAFGFGGGIGIGVGYNISPRIALNLSVSYLCGFPQLNKSYKTELISHDTTITYNWVTHENDTTVDSHPYTAVSENTFKKTVSAIYAGIGLIIKF